MSPPQNRLRGIDSAPNGDRLQAAVAGCKGASSGSAFIFHFPFFIYFSFVIFQFMTLSFEINDN